MERPKRPYSLHTRPTRKNDRRIYYALFRNVDGAYRSSAVSTGCTRIDDAVRWCEAKLRESNESRRERILAEYARDFWSPTGYFAMDRAAHGRSVSLGYLDIAESNTRLHILPKWGSCKLTEITSRKIDAWVVELYRDTKLAPATINKILQTFRLILERAVADDLLGRNPADRVRPVRAGQPQREILTATEAATLLRGDPSPGWTTANTRSTCWQQPPASGWARFGRSASRT